MHLQDQGCTDIAYFNLLHVAEDLQTAAGRLQASPSPCSVLPLIGNGLEGLGYKVPYVAILLYDNHSADWPFSPTPSGSLF